MGLRTGLTILRRKLSNILLRSNSLRTMSNAHTYRCTHAIYINTPYSILKISRCTIFLKKKTYNIQETILGLKLLLLLLLLLMILLLLLHLLLHTTANNDISLLSPNLLHLLPLHDTTVNHL